MVGYCVFAACFCLLLLQVTASPSAVVKTRDGYVQGTTGHTMDGVDYEVYLGIPFAKPPIGPLRWQKPVLPESWKGVRQVTEFGPSCTQTSMDSGEASEDCLYINVFVPRGVEHVRKLPVMVWIYGGGYTSGTASSFPMQELAVFGDVIVVSINYRLSSLGWLSTGDKVAPGNYGLWDVKAGLEWVQDNIRFFHGDPSCVTVFGQSAGGAMTSHVLISPHMRGLRHRAIAISGGSTSFFGISSNARDTTKLLCRIFRCNAFDDSQKMVNCLRAIDAPVLDLYSILGVVIFRRQLPTSAPVIDGDMVPQDPRISFEQGAADDCDFITGRTIHDTAGVVFMSGGEPKDNPNAHLAITNGTMNAAFKFILNMYQDPEGGLDAIWQKYPQLETESSEIRAYVATAVSTPWVFGANSHLEAEHHSRTSPYEKNTYHYLFQYAQSFLIGYRDWIQGSHGNDLYSVFGEDWNVRFREEVLGTDFKEVDRLASRNVMSYYTNFAHTGDPNVGPNAVPTPWPKYTEADKQYMNLGPLPTVYEESADQLDAYNFWNEEFTNFTVPRTDPVIDIDQLSDEEFEEILAEGIEEIQQFLDWILADRPETLNTLRQKIETAVAKRQKLIDSQV